MCSASTAELRILFVGSDDDQAQLLYRVLASSFQVVRTSSAGLAQSRAADGSYDALVLDYGLPDPDHETLLLRLRAAGLHAPALLLTPDDSDQTVSRGSGSSGDDYLSRSEALSGSSLVRAIVALRRRYELATALAAARAEATDARAVLGKFAHDLATPLGVVMGMTQLLLASDYGLNDDGRACLEDIALGATRACELLDTVIPRATSDVSPSSSAGADAASGIPPKSGRKMVLIADDDAATRRLVSVTLASDQYTVLQAADGAEAWRLVREHHPAVAILDWQMPVYSGLELTDVIKGDPQVRGMTVIMLTGRRAQADRDAGALARADLYLTKPFSPQELLDAVEHALGIS